MSQQAMQAVVFQAPGKFGLEKRPVPQLQSETDAIVRVTLASICTSAAK